MRVLTLPTGSHSPSDSMDSQEMSPQLNFCPLCLSLKIICGSETAERFPTAQAKINVCLSKDKTVFAKEGRGEEKSQEEWLSLEELAMLLSMMLKCCIFQYSPSPLHIPQSFFWMHCVYQAIP